MKTLLAVLQLTLVSQETPPGPETPVADPPVENKRVLTIDFEDDSIEFGPVESGLECYLGRPHYLIRIREDFDEKVMQSAAEM